MNNKINWLVGGVVIVVVVAIGIALIGREASAPVLPSSQPVEHQTVTAEARAWFEGFDEARFSLDLPQDVVFPPSTRGAIEWQDGDQVFSGIVFASYEGGRGFSPEDYYENVIKPQCPNCVAAPAPQIPGGRNILSYYTDGKNGQITIFQAGQGTWLFVADFYRRTKLEDNSTLALTAANEALKTFKLLEEKRTEVEAMAVKLYFSDPERSSTDCSAVAAVERMIPKTSAPATEAMRELLLGPTNAEKENGSYTALPYGSKLNSLRIENGIAYADFNAVTEMGGGSCAMLARQAQIQKTLLQFPTVKEVKFSIDGRTGDIFQP